MKRLIGIGLILMMILVLVGCGSSSSVNTNRITLNCKFTEDDSGTSATGLNGSLFHITVLTAGAAGLGPIADTSVSSVASDGAFQLRNIPTSSPVILKISYTGSGAFSGWYVIDASGLASGSNYTVAPTDLAAHTLTVDLIRSFCDFKLAYDFFGTDYDTLFTSVKTALGSSPHLSSLIGTSGSFYSFLAGKISATQVNLMGSILAKSTGATTLGGNKCINLAQVSSPETDPANLPWGSTHQIISEVGDPDASLSNTAYDAYLVTDDNLFNILSVEAMEQVNGASPKQIVIRVKCSGSLHTSSATNLMAIVRNPGALTTGVKTYTLSYSSHSGSSYYYTGVIPEADLSGMADSNLYYLLQVIDPSAQNWSSTGYTTSPTTIGLDRTPTVWFRLPYTVSGRVTQGSNGVSGVTISFSSTSSGSISGTTTDSTGNWSKSGLYGPVTVTPSKTGILFAPSSAVVTADDSGVNFSVTE